MGILNEQGERLARRVERLLIRTGLVDVSVISVDPDKGYRMILRRGAALHRIRIVLDLQGVQPETAWTSLLVTPSLRSGEASELANRGQSYLDERGHAHLVLEGRTVLFARPDPRGGDGGGRTSTTTSKSESSLADPLGRTGHQVAFALLCDPALAAAPMRQLAEASGASLGTTHGVVNYLEEFGFLRKGKLRNAGELLDRWVEAYRRAPTHTLVTRPMYSPDPDWLQTIRRRAWDDMLVSGPAVVSMLDIGLYARDGLVYTAGDAARVITALRLTPQETPHEVGVRRKFWGSLLVTTAGVVPAPLLYGDLLKEGDSRLVEAANDLRRTDAHLRSLDAR